MRLKLTIAYDGRPFYGWQVQPDRETVQGNLESAVSEISGAAIGVAGSGRTDTGVHALGQVAHFDTPGSSRLTPADWHRALNAKLPPAIRVMEITEAPPDFHSRFDATEKEYHYLIDTTEVLSPLRHGLVWHLPRPLDEKLATEALRTFIGTHDFGNFAANRGGGGESDPRDPVHTTRTIRDVVVDSPAPGRLEIRFCGTGFLYKMVRLLTGSAVQCALGKVELSWLVDTLENPGPETSKSHHLAPAGGLYLASVTYGSRS